MIRYQYPWLNQQTSANCEDMNSISLVEMNVLNISIFLAMLIFVIMNYNLWHQSILEQFSYFFGNH